MLTWDFCASFTDPMALTIIITRRNPSRHIRWITPGTILQNLFGRFGRFLFLQGNALLFLCRNQNKLERSQKHKDLANAGPHDSKRIELIGANSVAMEDCSSCDGHRLADQSIKSGRSDYIYIQHPYPQAPEAIITGETESALAKIMML